MLFLQIIEHEAVLASERRIQEAKRRLEEITAKLHAKKQAPQPSEEHGAAPANNGAGAQTTTTAAGLNPATQALVTAMATTMAAEQHEIDGLRRRLSHLRHHRKPHNGVHAVVNANATCTKACTGLNGTELTHCMMDCKALAALSTLASNHPTSRHRASSAQRSHTHAETNAHVIPAQSVQHAPPNLAQKKTAHKVAAHGGRAQEDENLAKIA